MRSILMAWLLMAAGWIHAQTLITGYEYWFGQSDGQRTLEPVPPGTSVDLNGQALNLGALPLGRHRVHYRVRDNSARWSTVIYRDFQVVSGQLHLITGYEYWFGQDDQDRHPTPITPTPAADVTVPITVPASLPLGHHRIHYRIRDNHGAWSNVLHHDFTLYHNAPHEVVLLRYWSDQAANPPSDMIEVPVAEPAQYIDVVLDLDHCTYLTAGGTTVFYQLKDNHSQWSVVVKRDIDIDVVGQAPGTPGSISGPSTVQSGSEQTYSVPAVPGASYYVWTLPNGWIGSSTTNSITVTAGGGGHDGLITVTAWNDCGSSTITELGVVVSGVGIDAIDPSSGIRLFPNPTTGLLTFQPPQGAQVHELAVLDATGRFVLSQPIANTTGPVTMDLSGHESGVYFVQVRFADGMRAVERVVKE